MAGALTILDSPLATVAVAIVLLWPAISGYLLFGPAARGRFTSTLTMSVGVGLFIFSLAEQLLALEPA